MPDLDTFLTVPETTPEPVEAPEPVAVETAPEPKGVESAPPAPELPPRGEDGKWVKREQPQPHMVPLEALLAEREKRQIAEAKAKEPKPDFWVDPDAAMDVRVQESEKRLLDEVDTRAEARARQLFLHYTEGAARGRYSDYDQVREVFAEEAGRNPVLATQLREAPDPAEFIYRQGKTALELRQVGGDLGAYRQRVEAEIRAKLEAEYTAKAARTASIPQSLNTEPSRGAGITGSNWNGPTPLEDILPNRRA